MHPLMIALIQKAAQTRPFCPAARKVMCEGFDLCESLGHADGCDCTHDLQNHHKGISTLFVWNSGKTCARCAKGPMLHSEAVYYLKPLGAVYRRESGLSCSECGFVGAVDYRPLSDFMPVNPRTR